MKVYQRALVPLASIVAGEDFAKYLELKAVSDVVHTLRTGREPAVPVYVRKRDLRVASGLDVVAAHVVLESYDLWCVPVDADEAEMVAMRVADESRIYGGHHSPGAAVELVETIAHRTNPLDPSGKRAYKSPRSQARAIVADLLGVTPEALRKQDERLKLPRSQASKKEMRPDWELETDGIAATAELLDESKLIHTELRNVDLALRGALARMTRLSESRRLGHDRYTRVYESLQALATTVRLMMPSHVCPYCKDITKVRETCGACWGGGYVSESDYLNASESLRLYSCVMYGGRLVDPETFKPWSLPLNTVYSRTAIDDTQPSYVDEPWEPAPSIVQDIADEPAVDDFAEPYVDPLDQDW